MTRAGRLGTRRPLGTWVAVVVAVVVGVMVMVMTWVPGASPARAHASLDSSSPAAFAVLEQSPDSVRLRFTEPPQPGLSTLRLIDGANRDVPVGPLEAAPDDARSVTASVDPLPDGVYVVVWSVVSGDGHRVSGSFAFSVGASSVEAARDLLARVGAGGAGGDAVLDTVVSAVRGLGFIALALLLGGAWLRHGTGGGRHAPGRVDQMIWVGWGWALTAALTLLPLQGAQVTGGRLGDVLDVDRWGRLLEVRQGQALVARVVLLALAAWMMVRGPRGTQRRSWHPSAAAVGLALAMTHTIAGHAATVSWTWLAVTVASVHLAAVAGWLGVVGGLAVGARRWSGGAQVALGTAAPLARAAVPVAVLTGVANTLLVGPPLDELGETAWGRWFLVKLGLVSVLIALGWMLGRTARQRSVPWRPRLVAGEVVIGVATFVAAAALVSTPPTASVVIEPVTTTLAQGGVLAEVTITPARVGANELHLVMSPPGGSLQPIGRVTARLIARDRDVPPFALDLAVAGVNHWTSPVQFPYGGRWQLEFVAEVRPLELVQYRTEFTISP